MNHSEHLLTIVAEEAVEIAQRATKALRFGLHEVQPDQPLNNAARLMGEFHDLLAALEMLHEHEGMRLHVDRKVIAEKKVKIEKFLAYSREMGTLQP